MEKKVRYYLIDSIRGFAIVNMVLYHLLYDMVYMFGFDMPFFRSEGAFIWERIVCSAFILLSGMCWHFSRNSLKRGLVVFLIGWAITLVTAIAVPAFAIWHSEVIRSWEDEWEQDEYFKINHCPFCGEPIEISVVCEENMNEYYKTLSKQREELWKKCNRIDSKKKSEELRNVDLTLQ